MPTPPVPPAPPGLRGVVDADTDGLVTLIGAAYAEHPGCVLDLPGVDADLRAPARTVAERGGVWWVLDAATGDDRALDATVGCGPVVDGTAELKRLYVAAPARGRGLGSALVAAVEHHAATRGAQAVELWSDTRFTAAHRRYTALGYHRTGEARALHDPSDTTEWRFVRQLPATAAPPTSP